MPNRLVLVGLIGLALAHPARADTPPPDLLGEGLRGLRRLGAEAARAVGAGEFAAAADALEKQVTALRKLHPKPHPDVAAALRNLGVVRANAGQAGQGLEVLARALAEYEGAFPNGHHDTASLLVQVAGLRERLGDRPAARAAWGRALAILDKLFPPQTHPAGHPTLVHVLTALGQFHMTAQEYEAARPHVDRAAALARKLYAPGGVPDANPDLARAVRQEGQFRHVEGKFPEAVRILEEALAAARAATPPAKHPNGHPDIAHTLSSLGAVFASQELLDKSAAFYEESLAMRRKLYPPANPAVVVGLTEAGQALNRVGATEKAAAYQAEAVALCEKLFPPERFPAGHPLYASCLNNQAALLSGSGKAAEAVAVYEKLVDWQRKALPGQPGDKGLYDLAFALNNLGSARAEAGDRAGGRAALEECLRLYEKRFPKEHFPLGHPQITLALYNLGAADLLAGADASAADLFGRSLAMARGYLTERFGFASESEALDRARNMPSRNPFLTAALRAPDGARLAYDQVWGDKALVARALERRHTAARLALADPATAPKVKANWDALIEVRRQVHEATLNPGPDPAAARRRIAELTGRKEDLERALAAVLPELARRPDPAASTPAELARRLRPRSAVVDLLRYTALDRNPAVPGHKGLTPVPSYTAFVLTPDGPVRRVELGPRKPIDEAVTSWRKAIAAGEVGDKSPAAAVLRQRVWDPVAAHLPADVETVFVCPDGDLARVPWAALPGRRPDTVLLEDHAVAVIPHAPFLLDRLADDPRPARADKVVALGEVDYGPAGKPYASLPGTAAELAGLTAAAGGRPVEVLRGSAADLAGLRKALPTARYAHLATHAFFAEGALAAEPAAKETPGQKVKPSGSGARNPLAYTGLVLAGANRPDAPERGIASGETLVALSLENLRLAVLSACETGLGAIDAG
ncbi:MAG TPA: CHAT domain-containing tetratricopeptide repeat protein, partial [Gemmataceae bacterium]|nr:CHAT domain-containing tetratricopeptide repeat protein [Gemmataceae bacterium]